MNEELKIVISAETQKLRSEVDKAKKEIKGFGDVSEEQMKAFDGHMENAKQACAGAMKAMAAAIAGTVAAVIGLAESTRELRNNQAKLQTAFESAGGSAETATKVYDELYSVLGDDGQATEAAAHLAKLTTNQKDLAEWTDIATGIYATFGDSLPLEGLTEAVNHTAKLGEVQGSLADALEWSGVNVDTFNEELAECNTEAEREKKIRDTLNKLYKTTADNYKKTNKEILKANDAQNRMNKSMANMGKTMEPVNTALKEMGASLMEEMEEPLEDVAKFLTNSFFPAIKKTFGWLKDNLPIVKGVLVGLTAAFVSYKAIALSVKLAEEGLTIAIIAKTAAQKAYNAVMKANPYGLAIAAIATLTAGILAYMGATKDATKEVEVLSEAEKELIKNAEDAAESFYAQQDAADETVNGIMIQQEKTKDLADELLGLVDANGRVQEADQAHVSYILGELNEALGTEYTMVNGVVQEYDKLKNGIYDVITAKTAAAMLEAHNEEYIQALQNENEALGAVSAAQKDYEGQLKKVEDKKKEYYEYEAMIMEWKKTASAEEQYALDQMIAKKWGEVEEEEKILAEKKGNLDTALTNYGNYYNTKNQYEEAAALIEQGKYQEAIKMLKNKSAAYFDYADDVDDATKEAIDALFKEAVDAGINAELTKQNFENGVEGYTEEMVKEAEEGYAKALEEWETAYEDANGVGGDLGDGIKDGLVGKEGSLLAKARSIVSGIISAMRKEADSHSPSRKTMSLGEDMGEGTAIGMENTTKDVVKASQNMISDSIKAMRGLSAANLQNAINGSKMRANTMPSAGAALDAPETISLLSAIGSKMGENTPIILQVDGKVFAQTAINTINQQTRQTGQLALNIY